MSQERPTQQEDQAGQAVAPRRKIIELVNEKIEEMANNPQEAERIANLAARAIKGGHLSPEWEEYMLQFVEKNPLDQKQLARLLAKDYTADDDTMNRRRAYLLGNAICGGDSPGTGTLNFTVATIDNGL
jgi:hypothetical protein